MSVVATLRHKLRGAFRRRRFDYDYYYGPYDPYGNPYNEPNDEGAEQGEKVMDDDEALKRDMMVDDDVPLKKVVLTKDIETDDEEIVEDDEPVDETPIEMPIVADRHSEKTSKIEHLFGEKRIKNEFGGKRTMEKETKKKMDLNVEYPRRVYRYFVKENGVSTSYLTIDEAAARQASNGLYERVWAWYSDREGIGDFLTLDEIKTYIP